jgi:hypothetical protein
MATTSTIGAMRLALLEKWSGLTWPALGGSGEPPVIFDGVPTANQPDNLIALGGTTMPTSTGRQPFAGLGGVYKYENYEIVCFVSCYVGGAQGSGVASSVADPSDAQGTAATNAYAILAVIETALRQDKQLSSVTNPPGILWCDLQPVNEENTSADSPEASMGRSTTIEFHVEVHGRIGPI